MEIIDLAVEKCIEIFNKEMEAVKECQSAHPEVDYGTPPKVMIIRFGKGTLTELDFRLVNIEKVWRYSDGLLEEAALTREQILKPISGRYFAEALAGFMIEEETKCVYLEYFFGPRYARGLRYSVEQQDDTLQLCNKESLWVS